ncbi:MAG: hypothetical protein J6Y02_18430 [Pseudobutyrivibrio sp.]|nr:hypothetical protein [Pseudobutyrivibrio sp.]
MSQHTIEMIMTIVVSVLGSSGIWAYLQSRLDKNDAKTKMILGLGHDRIIYLCEVYIKRGYLTHDEYENLYEYLFKPYKGMGGNGTAERLMEEVKKLPVRAVE